MEMHKYTGKRMQKGTVIKQKEIMRKKQNIDIEKNASTNRKNSKELNVAAKRSGQTLKREFIRGLLCKSLSRFFSPPLSILICLHLV